MVRRSLLACALAIVYLVGCVPDNSPKVQTSAGRQEAPAPEIDQFRLQDIPAIESADQWHNKYGPGLRLTTAHYQMFTTLREPMMLRSSLEFMESAYGAYNSQLPEQIETPTRLTIYLFADRRQWGDFTKDFTGDQAETFLKIKAGAYYHNGACVAYDIGPARTLSILAHEGWHQFSDRHFKFRPPSWLDEGVAMLFETNGAESGMLEVAPESNAYRLSALSRTLENGEMIPLRALIASNPGDVLATDQTEAVMAFYSQSYALVRFLREADSGRRLAAYHRLLADGLRGDWPLDSVSRKIAQDRNIQRNTLWNHVVGLVLFEDYVGNNYDKIEKEYLAFCRQIVADRLPGRLQVRSTEP